MKKAEQHVDLVTAHKPHFEIVETLLRYPSTAAKQAKLARYKPRPLFVFLYSG